VSHTGVHKAGAVTDRSYPSHCAPEAVDCTSRMLAVSWRQLAYRQLERNSCQLLSAAPTMQKVRILGRVTWRWTNLFQSW